MNQKQKYAIGCHAPEDWEYIHEILLKDGTLEDNIPNYSIECFDLKEHSSTRAVYFLSEEEALEISNHPKVKYIHIDYESYPETYKPSAEQVHDVPSRYERYSTSVKNLRCASDTYVNNAGLNRSGWQLLRGTQQLDPWIQDGQVLTLSTSGVPITSNIQYYGDGSDVDVIVADSGCWIGHSEFQTNTGSNPTNKRTSNVFPGNGTCDVLELVLDSPYYLDPEFFEAAPGRLETRWDGTIVPVESVSRAWWNNNTVGYRSSKFLIGGANSFGTIFVPDYYTRSVFGSNTAQATNDPEHGTFSASVCFGRTLGWAFNANKWVVNVTGGFSIGYEAYFNMLKIFHLYKPINSSYGNKNPTLSNNSWGFRYDSHRKNCSDPNFPNYYYFHQGASGGVGVAYTATYDTREPADANGLTPDNKDTIPYFMRFMGYFGDTRNGVRSARGEMVENSLTTAGKEMIDAGVIFVCSAGNSNQKHVNSNHPDYNNYWATNTQGSNSSLVNSTNTDSGYPTYNTTNRRHFPAQIGKYVDGGSGLVNYPAITVGAINDRYRYGSPTPQEAIVNYSMKGNSVDCYAPGVKILAAHNRLNLKNIAKNIPYPRVDNYPTSNFSTF